MQTHVVAMPASIRALIIEEKYKISMF